MSFGGHSLTIPNLWPPNNKYFSAIEYIGSIIVFQESEYNACNLGETEFKQCLIIVALF